MRAARVPTPTRGVWQYVPGQMPQLAMFDADGEPAQTHRFARPPPSRRHALAGRVTRLSRRSIAEWKADTIVEFLNEKLARA